MAEKTEIVKTDSGTQKISEKGEQGDHYIVRVHARIPDEDASQEERAAFDRDRLITESLGEEMRQSGAWKNIPRREGGREAVLESFRLSQDSGIRLLCFKNDESTGMLRGSLSHLLTLDYKLAICNAIYVRPKYRDGQSAALLLQAFRRWGKVNGADEMRILVTSLDNKNRTHDMLMGLNFAHLGGNYAFPLSERGGSVLGPHQAKSQENESKA